MINSNRNQSKNPIWGVGTPEVYFQMMNFSDLQSDFSHKLTVLTKILLGNLCWLVLIIIREFNGDFKSCLRSNRRRSYAEIFEIYQNRWKIQSPQKWFIFNANSGLKICIRNTVLCICLCPRPNKHPTLL